MGEISRHIVSITFLSALMSIPAAENFVENNIMELLEGSSTEKNEVYKNPEVTQDSILSAPESLPELTVHEYTPNELIEVYETDSLGEVFLGANAVTGDLYFDEDQDLVFPENNNDSKIIIHDENPYDTKISFMLEGFPLEEDVVIALGNHVFIDHIYTTNSHGSLYVTIDIPQTVESGKNILRISGDGFTYSQEVLVNR